MKNKGHLVSIESIEIVWIPKPVLDLLTPGLTLEEETMFFMVITTEWGQINN